MACAPQQLRPLSFTPCIVHNIFAPCIVCYKEEGTARYQLLQSSTGNTAELQRWAGALQR